MLIDMATPTTIPQVFIDAPDAARLLGMSERWFWAQVKKGLMPAGIRFGAKATRWRAADVIAAASNYPLAGSASNKCSSCGPAGPDHHRCPQAQA
jgi:predicted DNA-binding transcriptional regulator AlpA